MLQDLAKILQNLRRLTNCFGPGLVVKVWLRCMKFDVHRTGLFHLVDFAKENCEVADVL